MPEAEISHCGRIGRLPALVADGELPDVVLLDLSLPDTLGHSGIREIKGAYPGARVIALVRPLHNLADHPAEARIMLILSRFA